MKKIIIILIGILIAAGCCKDDNNTTSGIDCNRFADSFISNDYQYTKSVIDSICLTMPANPTAEDPLGHKINTENLLNELNDNCSDFNFELVCYACSKNTPLRSSIQFKSSSDQHFFEIEIEDKYMKFYEY